MLRTQVNIAQLAVFNPRTQQGIINTTAQTIPMGTLIGRIVATNKVAISASGNTDGSQVPIGVLMADYTVANGVDTTITFYVKGDMNFNMLKFQGSDTLATEITVSAAVVGTINDILTGISILPIATTENSFFDN